ncbi:hypothetical protein [Neisseria sp. 74A18]|uniref:hypothetical protein n=1 Tax=Neisseria sp. 74A18 TaxID=1696094 RepID=UPI000A435FE9|nr:hypothetical protein [Neisseria sp. 74A18]
MLSRLLIICFLLCLPIAIALLSQQMTRKVEPPKLPSSVVEVKLNTRQHIRAERLPDQEVPAFYTPRSVKHINPLDEGEYNPNPSPNKK